MKGRGLIIAFIILLAVCTVMIISWSDFGLVVNGRIGSGFFPFWVSGFVAVLIFIQIAIEIKGFLVNNRGSDSDKDQITIKTDKKLYFKPLLIILSLVAYTFAIDFFGFLVSSIVFQTAAMLILGNKIGRSFFSAILISGIIFIILEYGLKVRLPSGLLI